MLGTELDTGTPQLCELRLGSNGEVVLGYPRGLPAWEERVKKGTWSVCNILPYVDFIKRD